jgi:hypothetical protein
MKNSTLMILVALLVAIVFTSYALSELEWIRKERTPDPLRRLTGLPSLAVGNLSPSARNPGFELLCTGLYDVPGGYCNYFTDGVPFINYRSGANVTLGEIMR